MIKVKTLEEKVIPNLFLLAVFLFPLTRLGALELAFTIKPSEVLFGITFLIWLYVKIKKKDFTFTRSLLDLPLLGFLVAAAVSLFAAINLERGIAYWLWTLGSIVAIYFFSLQLLSNDEKLFKKALLTLLASGLVAVLFGFYQFFADYIGWPSGLRIEYTKEILGYARIQSTMLEPLYFGNFLLTVFPVMAALFITGFNKLLINSKWLYLILLLILTTVILTFSRGAWVGSAVSIIAIIILTFGTYTVRKYEFKKLINVKKFVLFMPVMVIISLLFSFLILTAAQNISDTGASDRSAAEDVTKRAQEFTQHSLGRFTAYVQAFDLLKTDSIIGIGIGNFGPTVEKEEKGTEDFPVVNNLHLEILTETGIFGFLFYLWVVLSLVFTSFLTILKSQASKMFWLVVLIGLFSSYGGIFVQQITYSTLNIAYFWFLLAMIISAQKLTNRGRV